MRRLLVLCSAVGLLCGALGCHSCCEGGHVHGRCDCDNGPEWGCHYELYCHGGHDEAVIPGPAAAPTGAAPMPAGEPLKSLPKEVMPTDDVK
jgi:hypothetical protein